MERVSKENEQATSLIKSGVDLTIAQINHTIDLTRQRVDISRPEMLRRIIERLEREIMEVG